MEQIAAWIAGALFGFVFGVLWKEHRNKKTNAKK
jgi:hypothetical protein